MMRGLLFLIALAAVFYAVKTLLRSALAAYHTEAPRSRLKGEEMVLDPQCRTYIVKERAVTRRIGGAVQFFCSEDCADRYEGSHRS